VAHNGFDKIQQQRKGYNSWSGLHSYTVRVLPYHPNLVTMFLPGYIKWAG
jgi:hypothetical protein